MDPEYVVERVFREIFDDDALVVTAETTPADVAGWDSVAQVKVVLAIEGELGIRFTTDEVSGFKKVGDFLQAIQGHLR